MTAAPTPARTLAQLAQIPVTRLRGLGEQKAKALGELGIESVFDLLTTYPFRYIDRSRRAELAELAVGDQAVVLATVTEVRTRRTRSGRAIAELAVHDGTAGMKVTFFNQPWRARQLPKGSEALFFGKLDTFRGRSQMTNPLVDVVVGAQGDDDDDELRRRRTLRIVPVYRASGKVGLSSWEIGGWIEESLRRAGALADPLPERWRPELGLVARWEAVHDIHVPGSMEVTDPARRRLAFDELLRLQLALVLRRRALESDARAIRHAVSPRELLQPAGAGEAGGKAGTLVQRFLAGLPYRLTAAQRKAMAAVFAEMAGPLPMHRLLQGDVGSGKTVVALSALLAAVQGGHQGALMVPTEVLAEQHCFAVRALVEGLSVHDRGRLGGQRPLSVALLTNRIGAAERARIRQGLESGDVDVVVGTQALLTEDVRFHSLGLVVIDEQHRFGVEQRAALRAKGAGDAVPDVLVMTATPIPRTAAMTVYGDLDTTTLDEMPPGRTPIATRWARGPIEE
ncbi:MAG: ATP-dependent DNA helicase RecG, partial [Acidimicrobiales bacterium]